METHFITKSGGGVTLEVTYTVARRDYLDREPGLRADLYRENRRKIMDQLEEKSGLPFAVAVRHIKGWLEWERPYTQTPEGLWYGLRREEWPVLLVTTCHVGTAEYRVVDHL